MEATSTERMEKLRRIKKKAGSKLPNRIIANEVGVTEQTVHRWLNEGGEPTSDAIKEKLDSFIGRHSDLLRK